MQSDEDRSTYRPALNRNTSTTSSSDGVAYRTSVLRRNRSLIRPERERIDPSHRQYHYRQAAQKQASENVAPSATGNQPGAAPERSPSVKRNSSIRRNPTVRRNPTLRRNPTVREHLLRRGKSILGREKSKDDPDFDDDEDDDPDDVPRGGCWSNLPSPWMTYCRIITCCIPKPALIMLGIPEGPAQKAWREKIGLVSCILAIMACVGFLTFGFTQAVCPAPALTLQGGQVNLGYLIIDGWAYMLADWSGHPAINGVTNASTNVLFSPLNAGGMDATFLFQSTQSECNNVLVPTSGSQPIYFPCQLFNPNTTDVPPASQFTNQTSCHLSTTARNMYSEFQNEGVPNGSGGGFTKAARVYYDWSNVNTTTHLMVFNGDVLNINLLQSLPTNYYSYPSNGLIQNLLSNPDEFGGKDMTFAIKNKRDSSPSWETEAECLSKIIKVGAVDTITIGCMASEIVLYVSLAVILGVILVKFFLAVIFGWFLSWRLGNFDGEDTSYKARMKREKEIENWSQNINIPAPLPQMSNMAKRRTLLPQISRFTQPEPGSMRYDGEKPPMPMWMAQNSSRLSMAAPSFGANRPTSVFFPPSSPTTPNQRFFGDTGSFRMSFTPRASSVISADVQSIESNTGPACPFPLSPYVIPKPQASYMPFKFPLVHTICLVTCYSEGEEGVRTTLDSIATSDYPNSHKLLLVVCDGIITGHGNSKSTPDVCVGMMKNFIVEPDKVEAQPYLAIADGAKRNNMAKVYAGFYSYDDATIAPEHQARVPMITIVKCGTEAEANESKPGNRGKRDSQIVLMQFLQKVMFNERMTAMEYEFFNAVWRVTGVTADNFEICLMVDADTKLYPDALTRLISCAVKDPEISGLCGETKIANKTDSWVSMIQVFEYYISHHQSKAFESIFGGVTCLPGCFCMYRIKAPKGPNGYWVPILANPDIVEHYSENVVDTLHKKNLLLLGEDRYLSTLMLRTFPNRKMMFVPQAVCKTVVPDTFKVLLSQRRRWINSTIHNLMELLFVGDLCGTFCFSMQFVVFMELVGTLALPAAISFTLYLIIMAIIGQPAIIPLVLLALILGLPAVLIAMTSRKVVYVGWMMLYLFSLPIWNFVLPTYAYWHFDDFSWGDTRKVEGAAKDSSHGDKEGEFDCSQVVMKRWDEYEKDRRTKLAKENHQPTPRFLERRKSFDVYREMEIPRRPGTSSSNDSELPLTEPVDYSQAGYNLASSPPSNQGYHLDHQGDYPMTTLYGDEHMH